MARKPARTDLPIILAPMGRKSHKDRKRDQKLTPREQRRSCLAWCASFAQANSPAEILDWRFDDETGTRADRSDYQAWLGDLRRFRAEGHRVIAVVRQFDRLGRDGEELYRAEKELKRLGVEVFDLKLDRFIQGEDWSDLIADAVKYGRTIGANVRRCNADVRANGWWRLGRPRWGYTLRPATDDEQDAGAPASVLVPDEERVAFVQQMFALAQKRQTLHAISLWASQLPAEARGGRAMSVSAIRQMLGAKVYIGQFDDGTPGRWAPIIKLDTFTAVQKILDAMPDAPARQATGHHLLTGLLRCGHCGARMTGASPSADGRHGARYLCQGPQYGDRHDCRCTFTIAQGKVNEPVLTTVAGWLAPLFAVERAELAKILHELDAEEARPTAGGDARRLRRRLDELVAEAGELARRLATGVYDEEEYQSAIAGNRQDRSNIKAQLAQSEQASGPAPEPCAAAILAKLDEWREWWHNRDVPSRRALLADLVLRVQAWRAGQSPDGEPVHVTPTPMGELLAHLAGAERIA